LRPTGVRRPAGLQRFAEITFGGNSGKKTNEIIHSVWYIMAGRPVRIAVVFSTRCSVHLALPFFASASFLRVVSHRKIFL